MKITKILQIGNFPPPLCGWAIHTQAVQNALHKRGAECVVLDIGPGRKVRKAEPGCTPVRGGLDYLIKILSFRFRGYTAVPHVNGESWQGYLLALAAVLLGRLTGKPAVLMFHAGPIQKYFPKQEGPWHLAFGMLFHASGCILCNMESVKQEIEKFGVASEKVQAMFAANYPEEALPVPLASTLEQFLQAHQPRLFSYMMFRPEFTPEVLFQAFAGLCEEFPRAGLFIAGPPEVPPEIMAMLKKWGLESRVTVAGNMAHDEFLTAIQRSDVFVRTPVSDGLCASVIEALSLGVPVVAVENGTRPASVITYYPPEAPVLLETLTKVLRNLEQMRAGILSPSAGSELDDEVALLVAFANGETR